MVRGAIMSEAITGKMSLPLTRGQERRSQHGSREAVEAAGAVAGPFLPAIECPADLKRLSLTQLEALGAELRQSIIEVVSKPGGHLAPSLGAVELTLALHYVYDTPRDRIVWDVGHQAYAHKVITGRRDRLPSLRQYQGLSGFISPAESPYDAFGVVHA